MPKWIHDRAAHLRAKNPDMSESQSWAIATQQAHALGKSPKSYGTPQGREEAKAKYTTPSDDEKKAKGSEMDKVSKELTTEGREHVKAKNFALTSKQSDTGKPAYPIHDKAHAANALARVKQFGTASQRAEVYKDVAKKYPELAERSDVPALREKAAHDIRMAAFADELTKIAEEKDSGVFTDPIPGTPRLFGRLKDAVKDATRYSSTKAPIVSTKASPKITAGAKTRIPSTAGGPRVFDLSGMAASMGV